MDPEKIRALATLIGMDPEKVAAALSQVNQEEEEGGSGSFLKNFYFNPNVFMKLHSIDYAGLRQLVMPNLRRLRR